MLSLGIDLGGTKTEIVALDNKNSKILFKHRVDTIKGKYTETLNTISFLVKLALDELKIEELPIGIAIPGAYSLIDKKIKNANSYWLNGNDLVQDLKDRLKINQIYVENDANCFALSEAMDGAGSNYKNVWGIILGTGTGSGIVINKQLLIGPNRLSGEWGHNPLPWISNQELEYAKKLKCFCGKENCQELFISGTGLQREYSRLSLQYNNQDLNISGKEIYSRFLNNEPIASECIDNYLDRLARSLACYCNFLDPDVIILGGGVSNIDILYDKLPDLIKKYIFGQEFYTKILKATYGDSSGVRGAAWLPYMHMGV